MSHDRRWAPDLSGFDRLEEIANDPAKLAAWKAAAHAKAKREMPWMTDEALEAQWEYVKQTFLD